MALLDRLDQVADVQRPVAIVAIELVPVTGEVDFSFPLPEEGRLAVAGIGREDDGAAAGHLIEPVEQPGTPQSRGHVVR